MSDVAVTVSCHSWFREPASPAMMMMMMTGMKNHEAVDK